MGERTSGRNISGLYQPFAAALNKTCNASNHTGPVVLNTANDIAFGRVYIWVTTSLFGVILLTSLVGNSLVTFTILRRKNMRTPCNFFIMNIALADIGVGAIAAPLRILEMFLSWPFWGFYLPFPVANSRRVRVCIGNDSYYYRSGEIPCDTHASQAEDNLGQNQNCYCCYLAGMLLR